MKSIVSNWHKYLILFCFTLTCCFPKKTTTQQTESYVTHSVKGSEDRLKKVNITFPIDSISPHFVAQLPMLNVKKWHQKKQFQGKFSIDSVMQLIFGNNYLQLACDDFGNASTTEILNVALWKAKNANEKRFTNYWVEGYVAFPDTTNEMNETRVNGDTLISLSNKNYAIVSTSTIANKFPDFMRVGRFSAAFLGIALLEQKGDTWELQFYNPAIGYYGSFSTAPKPQIHLIGQDNLAVVVEYANGGAGGPFYRDLFIHLLTKDAPLVFSETCVGRYYDGKCEWQTQVSFDNNKQERYSDLVLISNGHIWKESFKMIDEDISRMNLSKLLQNKMEKQDDFDFNLQRKYHFQGKKYKLTKEILVE